MGSWSGTGPASFGTLTVTRASRNFCSTSIASCGGTCTAMVRRGRIVAATMVRERWSSRYQNGRTATSAAGSDRVVRSCRPLGPRLPRGAPARVPERKGEVFLRIATRGIVAHSKDADRHATDCRLLGATRRRHDGLEPRVGQRRRDRPDSADDLPRRDQHGARIVRQVCGHGAGIKVVLVPMRHEDGIHVVVGVASAFESRTFLRRTDGVLRDPVPERSVHQERPPLDVHEYTGVRNVTNLRRRWRHTHGLSARLKQADRQRTPVERLRGVLCGGRPSHRPAVRDRDGKYGSQQDACEHDRRLAPTGPAG